MAKTKNLGLNLTTDDETLFGDWRKSIDGENGEAEKSNMQIIDEAVGSLQNSSGGTANLKGGEGQDSVVQVYTGEVDDTHYESTSTGENAAIFGEANKNTANRALMAGKLNENNGANAIMAGIYNKSSERGTSGITVGYQNVNNHENSIVGGLNNNNNGPFNLLMGVDNWISQDCESSIVGGKGNEIRHSNVLANGMDNYVSVQNGTALGIGLIVEGLTGKTVVGKYNANNPDAIFEVGVGENDFDRRNAFEVYEDGSTNLGLGGSNVKLYHHDIKLSYLNTGTSEHIRCVLSIYTNSSAEFTLATLFTHLNGKDRMANGYYRPPNGESTYNINRIQVTGTDSLTVYCNNPDVFKELFYKIDGIVAYGTFGCSDTVTKIL